MTVVGLAVAVEVRGRRRLLIGEVRSILVRVSAHRGWIWSVARVSAGDYSVKWEGTGSNVQVNILKGSAVIASTTARVVDLEESSASNSTLLRSNGDGSKSLSEIRFNGKKYALAIEDQSPSAEMSGSSK